jgi:hypothetical protein
VACGVPFEVAGVGESRTAAYLAQYLEGGAGRR